MDNEVKQKNKMNISITFKEHEILKKSYNL